MTKEQASEKKKLPITGIISDYETIIEDEKKLGEKNKLLRESIRNSALEVVVCFVDLVGSTQFKLDHMDQPERWLLRLKQFGEIVKDFVTRYNGRVVKYIGDEVMAVFDKENFVEDSIGFLLHQRNIETLIEKVSGEPTATKIAIDTGSVYFLDYSEHPIPDPQGLPVDRCSRISKYCRPSTILTSFHYVKIAGSQVKWADVGKVFLKGVGDTTIYQLGQGTVKIESTVELSESHYESLKQKVSELESDKEKLLLENRDAKKKNKDLVDALNKIGREIPPDASLETELAGNTEQENEWAEVMEAIKDLRSFIRDSPGGQDYARFLFLHEKGSGDRYNVYEGRTFDACIDAQLVQEEHNGYYTLNADHPRNVRALEKMLNVDRKLGNFLSSFDPNPDDLFEYSFADSEFWSTYVGFNVRS